MKSSTLSFFSDIGGGSAQTLSSEEFQEIYLEYRSFVRRSIYWMAGEELVDDLVQETFVKVWKKVHLFKGQASLKTWIYRIAVNTARDHWKRSGRIVREIQPLQESQKEDQIILAQIIDLAILIIPEKQRACFVLHYKMELSLEEIADILEIPTGTVKSRLSKGRKIFIRQMEKHGVYHES